MTSVGSQIALAPQMVKSALQGRVAQKPQLLLLALRMLAAMNALGLSLRSDRTAHCAIARQPLHIIIRSRFAKNIFLQGTAPLNPSEDVWQNQHAKGQ